MPILSEIIYLESIMTHLTSFEVCPVFEKNRAKVRLCVCTGVLVVVTYGHDRFFVTVTSCMDIIRDQMGCASLLSIHSFCVQFVAACVEYQISYFPSNSRFFDLRSSYI